MAPKRHLVLLFIAIALAAPAWGQTIYALHENRSVFIVPGISPYPVFDLVQFTGIASSGLVEMTSLMPLPVYSHVVAFDAGRQRVFLIRQVNGDDHLYVADVQTKALTRSDIVATGLTFVFDTSRDTLSGQIYVSRMEDWGVSDLLMFDMQKGTVSGMELQGDVFEVVVVPAVPPKQRVVRPH